MSTYCTIAIKHSVLKNVLEVLKEYYIVGKEIKKGFLNQIEYLFPDRGYRTFILHKEQNTEWVQIDYELENVYEFDEFLKRLTKELRTTAFIGYNQTTNEDFRFVLFDKGELKRSIFIKYTSYQDEMRIMDNFGEKLPFEKFNFGIPITKKLSDEHLLDYETLNLWYKELGFICEDRDGIEYLHLEIKNFKN